MAVHAQLQQARASTEVRGCIKPAALKSIAALYLPLAAVCGFSAGLALQCLLGIGYAAGLALPWRLLDAAVWAGFCYLPLARLSRTNSWLSFDGTMLRARRLFTRRYLEKPVSTVIALERVTFGQYGELEGRRVRFADGSSLAFGLAGYSDANHLLASLQQALAR